MRRFDQLAEDPSQIGQWARWAAAPYCEFKDDRARLLALIARDIRKLCIAAVFATSGYWIPWRELANFMH